MRVTRQQQTLRMWQHRLRSPVRASIVSEYLNHLEVRINLAFIVCEESWHVER